MVIILSRHTSPASTASLGLSAERTVSATGEQGQSKRSRESRDVKIPLNPLLWFRVFLPPLQTRNGKRTKILNSQSDESSPHATGSVKHRSLRDGENCNKSEIDPFYLVHTRIWTRAW